MKLDAFGRLCLVGAIAVSASGCALLPHRAKWAKVTPITSPTAQMPRDERYYQDAVAALDRRDYGRALEALQVARELKVDDVRVWNAFGVVYDKLGRFDLSARYYNQALKLDPNSTVVARNMAYSAQLQAERARPASVTALAFLSLPDAPSALTAAAPASAAVPARPTPQPMQQAAMGRVVQVGPGVVRLEPPRLALAQGGAPGVIMLGVRSSAPVLTGRPLVLVNATGRAGGAEPLRQVLAGRGWTAPRSASVDGPRQALTTIRYAPEDVQAAKALARTLPAPVRLAACDGGCDGIKLIVGADAAGWILSSRRAG